MIWKADLTAGLLQRVSEEGQKLPLEERRNFLKNGLLLAGGVIAGGAMAAKARAANENLPPNVPGWTRSLGPGVLTNPYGKPSRFEKHIVRRNVPWLTADRIASISFTPLAELDGIITPSSLVFERYHAGIPDIDAMPCGTCIASIWMYPEVSPSTVTAPMFSLRISNGAIFDRPPLPSRYPDKYP